VKGIEPSYSAWKSQNFAARPNAVPTIYSVPSD
jgi:hypothetical protein